MSALIRPAIEGDKRLSSDPFAGVELHRLIAAGPSNEVVGEVSIVETANGEPLQIANLFVEPAFRRKGSGLALVQHAFDVAKAHGAEMRAIVPRAASDATHVFDRAGWSRLEDSGNSITFASPVEGAEHVHKESWSFETVAVRAGAPEEPLGPVVPPIGLSSTYRVDHPGSIGRWDYARAGNPTRDAYEEALAELEGGAGAGAFASGLAAIDAALRFLKTGQRVVVSNDVYGGTWRLLNTVWDKVGVSVDPVDLTNLEAARKAIKGAAMVIAETPSNPLLRILDIAALAEACKENGALLAVDNTFATPYLQRPFDLGADLVIHSATKYLGGHSDVIGGALIAKSTEHVDYIRYLQKAAGGVAAPFDSYLVLRGIRTLPVRMDRHCENALKIAQMLEEHPLVSTVMYPGLESDPGYELAKKQMRAPGGMISFRHAGGPKEARRTVQRTKLFTLAESLGAVESLIEVPAAMTHASTAGSLLEVPDDLIRLSVGVENADDLLNDLRQALR